MLVEGEENWAHISALLPDPTWAALSPPWVVVSLGVEQPRIHAEFVARNPRFRILPGFDVRMSKADQLEVEDEIAQASRTLHSVFRNTPPPTPQCQVPSPVNVPTEGPSTARAVGVLPGGLSAPLPSRKVIFRTLFSPSGTTHPCGWRTPPPGLPNPPPLCHGPLGNLHQLKNMPTRARYLQAAETVPSRPCKM